MYSDQELFKRILCQFLVGGGLGVLLSVALLLTNANQLYQLITNSPSPNVLLCIFVSGLSMYIGFGAAITGFLFVLAEGRRSGTRQRADHRDRTPRLDDCQAQTMQKQSHRCDHPMSHRPPWMSNFTKPSSRIFKRRVWHAS